jgi:AcrR family transcriptional regulator
MAVAKKTTRVRTRLDPEVRRELIVKAAFKAVAKEGFEGLRTRDIARRAGINIATLHHYFPAKEDLIAAVADHLESRFRAEKTEPAAGESALDALNRQWKDGILYYFEQPEMLAVYREYTGRAARDPALRRLVERLHSDWRADIVAILQRGRSDGSLRADFDPEIAARVILSTVWGLIAHIFSSKADFDAAFQELTRWLARPQATP